MAEEERRLVVCSVEYLLILHVNITGSVCHIMVIDSLSPLLL